MPSGSDFAPNDGGPLYYTIEYLYLGSTAVQMSTALPSITSINPTAASVESSGTITVAGGNLADICTGVTSAAITGPGVTLTVGSVSSDGAQAVLNYSIAASASTGNQSLTLGTCFGTSNAATFQVGDPTPVITSVSPNIWPPGVTTPFTVSGSGFGTAPTITVTGNGVTNYSMSCTTCDTQISGTVTIAANAPARVATITVTSTGYYGSGFISTGGGGSSSATAQATITFTQGTAPTIIWGVDSGGNNCGGTNIAGQTQNVVVGQQTAFTGCFSVPQGGTILIESWSPSVPPGSVVAGYNASTAGGSIVPFQSATCIASGYCDFPTFYWVDTGGNGSTFTFTYEYALNGSVVKGTASLPFSVTGPTPTGPNGAFFTATPGAVNVWPPSVGFGGGTNFTWLELGNGGDTLGIDFEVTATGLAAHAGAFQWVNLIGPNSQQYLTNPATPNQTRPPGCGAVLEGAGCLDNWYPYVTSAGAPNSTNDSPGIELIAYDQNHNQIPMGEGADSFSATMYLMWDPALPGPGQTSCAAASTTVDPNHPKNPPTSTASTCTGSIPIPLGYALWGYNGDAINTLKSQPSTNTTWLLNCGAPSPQAPAFQATTSYPKWAKLYANAP